MWQLQNNAIASKAGVDRQDLAGWIIGQMGAPFRQPFNDLFQ
jgi:hypothetical protein